MESSIAVFLMRRSACELLPTVRSATHCFGCCHATIVCQACQSLSGTHVSTMHNTRRRNVVQGEHDGTCHTSVAYTL